MRGSGDRMIGARRAPRGAVPQAREISLLVLDLNGVKYPRPPTPPSSPQAPGAPVLHAGAALPVRGEVRGRRRGPEPRRPPRRRRRGGAGGRQGPRPGVLFVRPPPARGMPRVAAPERLRSGPGRGNGRGSERLGAARAARFRGGKDFLS